MIDTQTPARIKRRLIVTFIFIGFLCAALTFRVGWVQIVNGEEYSRMAMNQQIKDVPVAAKRGAVFDRNGKELAMSAAAYSVWARPAQIKAVKNDNSALAEVQINNTAADLALTLGMDVEEVKEIITQDRARVKIARGVDEEQAGKLREKRLKGIEIADDVKRYYPLGAFVAHLLGSVTDDNNGLTGIELQYNRNLVGIPGRWIKNADIAKKLCAMLLTIVSSVDQK